MSSLISSSGLTGFAIPNGAISVTDDGANNLTVAIVTAAGTDPSPTNPLYIAFNNPASYTSYTRIIAYPLKIVIPAGATLGLLGGAPARIWIAAYDVNGTVQLAVSNRLSGTDVLPFRPDTSMGEATSLMSGSANSAGVQYSNPAISASFSPYRVIGSFAYEIFAFLVAGNWGSAGPPDRIEMVGPGTKRPTELVQRRFATSGAVASGTTLIPLDDTIPQQSEGDSYLTLSIRIVSRANVLKHRVLINGSHSLAAQPCILSIGVPLSGGDTLAAAWQTGPAAGAPFEISLAHRSLPVGSGSIGYAAYVGGTSGGTFTLNGVAAARKLGGALASTYEIEEIMG